MICWKRYSEAPNPPTTKTFYKLVSSALETRLGCSYLDLTVLCLNGDNLVADQLEDTVHDRLEALKDLLVHESHVTLLNTGIGEVGLDTHIHCPFLPVVAEVGLDTVLKVHDTLRVDLARSSRAIWQLHLTDLRP